MSYDDWKTTEPVDAYADDLDICPDCLDVDCQCEPEPPEQDEPEHCISCGLLETRCVCGVGEYEAWNAYAADWEAA